MPRDGFNAQQWIGQQLWCDGKIGMYFGVSHRRGRPAELPSITLPEASKNRFRWARRSPHLGNETPVANLHRSHPPEYFSLGSSRPVAPSF